MTKTLATMLDDRSNKTNKNSFVNGHRLSNKAAMTSVTNNVYLSLFISKIGAWDKLFQTYPRGKLSAGKMCSMK